MKLYGSYSELEDHYVVWKVVGFNTDFGEFWPVKTLHSRDAAEDLAARLNVEDHGSGTNQSIMQEFSKYLELRKPPIKAPFSTNGEPCICHYPMKYEDWCFYCGGSWNNRSYDAGVCLETCICKWPSHETSCKYYGGPYGSMIRNTHVFLSGLSEVGDPVPQADGAGDSVRKFPTCSCVELMKGSGVDGENFCISCFCPIPPKWYSLDQLFPNDTIHNPLYGSQLCSCESPDDRYECHYCYTCGLNTAL